MAVSSEETPIYGAISQKSYPQRSCDNRWKKLSKKFFSTEAFIKNPTAIDLCFSTLYLGCLEMKIAAILMPNT